MDPIEILLRLLLAHLISDYIFQWKGLVENKEKNGIISGYFWTHILITGLAVWIVLPGWEFWYIALIVAVTHLAIDWWKVWVGKDNLFYFTLDQVLHILVLIGCWFYLMGEMMIYIDSFFSWLLSADVLAYVIGFIIVIWPASFFIQKATSNWTKELETGGNTGLKDAGRWIGTFERILVLIFVLMHQYQAIGFLIAAKSILRFGGMGEENKRKQTEYVLVGTLLSFTIAIIVGIAILAIT